MSSRPQPRQPADPAPSATARQRHSRLGAAFGAKAPPARCRPDRPSPRLVVIVEADHHVGTLVRLTLGEIAEVLTCETSEETLAATREHGGNVVLVRADLHLAGTVSSLDLARTVIERWPGTHMLLTSGGTGLLEQAPSGLGFLTEPWCSVDLTDELGAARIS